MAKERATLPDRATRPSADPTRDRIVAAAATDLFAERTFGGATTRRSSQSTGGGGPATVALPLPVEGRSVASRSRLVVRVPGGLDGRPPGADQRHRRALAEPSSGSASSWSSRLATRSCIASSPRSSKSDSERMDYLVEYHVRPLYEATVALFEHLVRDGIVAAHPTSAPVLHPHRSRSHDVRARSGVPAAHGSRSRSRTS